MTSTPPNMTDRTPDHLNFAEIRDAEIVRVVRQDRTTQRIGWHHRPPVYTRTSDHSRHASPGYAGHTPLYGAPATENAGPCG